MDGGRIISGVLVVLVVIGGLYYKYGARDRFGDEVKGDVLKMLQTLPDYSSYEGLYEQLVEAHSKEIFDKHSSMRSVGRRRVQIDFDEDAYLDELFLAMSQDAAAQGYKKQADEIKSLRPEAGTQSAEPKRRH